VDELRASARSRIDLRLTAPATEADLAAFAGIADATAADATIHLVVEGSVDPVLKAAARLTVHAIATQEADLEDVFLSYYQEEAAR
jgi:ABC-2 type transport system ATP-binding protein